MIEVLGSKYFDSNDIVNMLKETDMSKEQIAHLTKVSVEEVEELAKELQEQ